MISAGDGGRRTRLAAAPDELPAADAAVAAAGRPASGARASGTPRLGSTADSNGGCGRYAGIRGAGRSAGRDAGRWSKKLGRDYGEGLLPAGPPERSAISLGHSFGMSSPSNGRDDDCLHLNCALLPLLSVTACPRRPFSARRPIDRRPRTAPGNGRRQGRRR